MAAGIVGRIKIGADIDEEIRIIEPTVDVDERGWQDNIDEWAVGEWELVGSCGKKYCPGDAAEQDWCDVGYCT